MLRLWLGLSKIRLFPGNVERGCCRCQCYYIVQNVVDGCNLSAVRRKMEITGQHYVPIHILTGENAIRWVESWMDFYKALYQHIIKIDEQTLELVDETSAQYMELQALIEMKQKELEQTEQAIENLFELFEDGAITKQRLSDRIAGHEKTKAELETEIEKYKTALAAQGNAVTVEMVQRRIDGFKELWTNAINPNEQNRAFKLLVDRIVYDREEIGLRLEVLYK